MKNAPYVGLQDFTMTPIVNKLVDDNINKNGLNFKVL